MCINHIISETVLSGLSFFFFLDMVLIRGNHLLITYVTDVTTEIKYFLTIDACF